MTTSAGSSARIRRLAPADAGAYRELRLAALANHPQAFGSSHEDEVRFDDDRWYQRLSGGADLATFGAAVDGQLVGTATCVRESHRKERHRACLVGMYVTPAARGRGIGAQLVTAVISHARDHGVDQLELDVVQGAAAGLSGQYRQPRRRRPPVRPNTSAQASMASSQPSTSCTVSCR